MRVKINAIVEKYFDIQAISFACGIITSCLLRDLQEKGYFFLTVCLCFVGFGISIFITNRYVR